jgi:hypothetical protein
MTQRPRVSRPIYVSMAALAALLVISYFPLSAIRAANSGATILPSTGKPLVNLKNPQTVKVTYTGASDAVVALQSGGASPTAMASADFDADGAPDVVAGYSTKAGGVLILYRGNPDAYAPTDLTLYGKAAKGKVPPTFMPKAQAFSLAASPDLIATGDFNRDGHKDVLVGTRGGGLYLLAGDGRGNLLPPQVVPLTGQVTAMDATGDSHVAVSTESPSGSQLVILNPGAEGLTAGASYPLPDRGDAVAWGNLGGGADVAIGAGANVVMIYNALKENAQTEIVPVPVQVKGLALGDFIWDQDGRQEISVLGDDGSIHILQHGTLITAPLTAAQLPGRRAAMLAKRKQPSNPTAMGAWSVAKQLPYTGSAPAGAVSPSAFSSPRVAASSTHDLMVLDAGQSQVHILDTSGKTASPSADISFTNTPVAALALPQKIDSGRDIVVLAAGQTAPVALTVEPDVTLTVNTVADIDTTGVCTSNSTAVPNPLSLRAAVCIANNSAPATSTINIFAGTFDLTSFETGELQVDPTGSGYSLTINSTGTSANTLIQQTDGHDRVFEIDVFALGNMNVTFENVTLQGGTCTTGQDCTYGGAAILDGGSTSPDNLTLTNVVVSNNTAGPDAGDGENGGAMDLTASGTYIFTNCTFSGNKAVYGSSNTGGGPGGAVYIEENAGGGNVTITNCSFTNNTSQWGGGGALYSWLEGSGNTTTISGSTFTGNSALDDASDGDDFGGAIYALGDLTISNSRITGNTTADGSSHGTGLYANNGAGFSVTATNNWWGCNGGPGASGCDTVDDAAGTLTFNPWLVLSISANPTSILPSATSLLTASLTENSNNVGGFSVPNGTSITFGGTLDSSVNPTNTTLTSGQATSTYTAGSAAGNGTGTATVDNQEVSTPIDILVAVTVTTSPGGLSIIVDGTTYAAPQTFNWVVGSSHTLNTTSPQNVSGGSEQVWSSWSQGGAQSQSVTAPSSSTTYTANFTTQYQLTTAANPTAGGTVSPTSGTYYTSGTVVPLTATANAGYSFTNWTGNVANSTSASTSITMTAPQSVTANFSLIIVATPTTTSVSSNNDPSFTTAPGNSVTFTATVTSNSTVNEGTVTFSDTANDFTCSGGNTVPVSNGQASCTTSFSTEVSENITATYNGTVNFQTSFGFITQTVNNHTVVTGNQFCNQGPITVPSTAGAATPYPSNIFVSGLTGNVGAVIVQLNNISSSDIAQTDLLLVGPTGAQIIPFASVGDSSTIGGVNITLDDSASSLIPGGSPLTTGSYKPTSITGSTSLIFPAPAPLVNASNYAATDGAATLTSTFQNTAPNGTWELFAMDHLGNGAASIGGGWCVNISPATVQTTITTSPAGLLVSVDGGTATAAPLVENWIPGSSHTIATTSPQAGAPGVQYVWSNWSDSGAISHSITVPPTATTYTAAFNTQYQLTTQASPPADGTVTPASGGYYASGAIIPVTATANSGFTFSNWTSTGGSFGSTTSASTNFTMPAAPATVTGNFGNASVQITITTTPANLLVSVDGGTATAAPLVETWVIGSSHTIATTSPQSGGTGVQYVFSSWSDGGTISHSITVPSTAATYTAGFSTQYQLTTAANPSAGGTVSPTSGGFYASGTVVSLAATPNAGYTFTNWTGSVANPNSATTTITMSAPESVTANFAAPTVTLTPTSINFGTAYLHSLNGKDVAVKNTGNTSVTIDSVTVTPANGTNKDDFTDVNFCPKTLAAGKSCAVSVVFFAGNIGSLSATLNVNDNASGSPQQVSLSATVINPQASYNPRSLNFGTVTVGHSSTKDVTLTNSGTTALDVTSISVTGPNKSDYTRSNACPSSLSPGADCVISVTFAPSQSGPLSADLTVVDNAAVAKQNVALTGSGSE